MSSFLQKLEAALVAIESEASAAEHALIAWFKRLIHHQRAGDVINPPPQSGTGDGSGHVGFGAAPTPVVSPAPTPAPTPVPAPTAPPEVASTPTPASALPEGVLAYYPGSTEIVKLKDVEDFRAAHADDPIVRQMAQWFIIEGLPTNGAEANANLTQAKQQVMLGATNPKRFDAAAAVQAFRALPDINPDGSPIGFGYKEGPQYPNVLSFYGDNIIGGEVDYRGPRITDMPQLLANCWSDLQAARARQEPDIRLLGCFPIIAHTPVAAVAP